MNDKTFSALPSDINNSRHESLIKIKKEPKSTDKSVKT